MVENLTLLMSRISKSDQAAFSEIFHQFSPKVYAFALKLTHSECTAQEIVQEVFLKVWLNRKTLTNIDYFPSYLYAITRNHGFNVLKRIALEEKAKAVFLREHEKVHFETEESVIFRDHQQILEQAIDRLPPQQKLVYGLCHGEGLKYKEAAEKLRISPFTVKTHMQQALRSIKLHVGHLISVCGLVALYAI